MPPSRWVGALQSADLSRGAIARDADRTRHEKSRDASVEGRSIRPRSSSDWIRSPTRKSIFFNDGLRTARARATARDLPAPPAWSGGWQLGKPDLVVTMPAPFVLAADGPDVSRVFVLPLPVDRQRYVRGIEFRANNPRIHHANIRIDATPASRELDEQDAVPGYDGIILRSAMYPDGHFLGWTPGQAAPLLPPGLAWTLAPRSDFVLQLHLVPSGKPELIQPSIGVYFTDDPPARTPVMMRLSDQRIDIPSGRCASTLPVIRSCCRSMSRCVAVQPHAHYLAREVVGHGDAAGWHKPNAHLDCRLGPAVAARLSVSNAGSAAEGHHRHACGTDTTTPQRTPAIPPHRRCACRGDSSRAKRWAICGCRS